MENQGSLRLILVTAHGTPLDEKVEIRLTNKAGRDNRVVKVLAGKPILILHLKASPSGLYNVEIFPETFEPQSRRVRIRKGERTELCVVFRRQKDGPCPPSPPCPSPKIPDQLDEPALTNHLTIRLAGTPADGSTPSAQLAWKVIWVDHGDEVLVHLDSLKTRIMDGTVLISVELETDQTGRTPLVVSFAVGGVNDPAGLVATTDEFPRGNGILAARWGRALQAAAWASLLAIAADHASERASAPRGIAAVAGKLALFAGPPLKVTGVA